MTLLQMLWSALASVIGGWIAAGRSFASELMKTVRSPQPVAVFAKWFVVILLVVAGVSVVLPAPPPAPTPHPTPSPSPTLTSCGFKDPNPSNHGAVVWQVSPGQTCIPDPTGTPYAFHSVVPTPTFNYRAFDTPTPTLAPMGPENPVYGHCYLGNTPHSGTAAEAYLYSKVGQEEGNCGLLIVVRESNWNSADVNGGSGACGIPQAIYCQNMAPGWVIKMQHWDQDPPWGPFVTISCVGEACPGDYAGQINWMIRYVHGRYGTFFTAWVMWGKQGYY